MFACESKKNVDYATFSVKLTSGSAKGTLDNVLFHLTDEQRPTIKIKSNNNNTYIDTIRDMGFYYLDMDINGESIGSKLYFKKGDAITLEYDTQTKSFKFSGNGSAFNEFRRQKENLWKKLKLFDVESKEKLYSKSEADFLKSLNEIKQKSVQFLEEKAKELNLSEKFIAVEEIDIKSLYSVFINDYPGQHARIKGVKKHTSKQIKQKIEEAYKEIMELNNPFAYESSRFCLYLMDFAEEYFQETIDNDTSNRDTDDNETVKFYIDGMKTSKYLVKNKEIRNSRIGRLFLTATIYVKNKEDLEKIYRYYQSLGITDELYKVKAKQLYEEAIVLAKGAVSPKFVNYENYNGGTTSLDDLKGKYVFIDVWSTRCGPCIDEIPFVKELEKKYHGRNIHFVNISVDLPREKERWIKMVKAKKMGGIRLFSGDPYKKTTFMKGYKLGGIPHYILIDPEGKIVSPMLPRHSAYKPNTKDIILNPKLIELFDELKI